MVIDLKPILGTLSGVTALTLIATAALRPSASSAPDETFDISQIRQSREARDTEDRLAASMRASTAQAGRRERVIQVQMTYEIMPSGQQQKLASSEDPRL